MDERTLLFSLGGSLTLFFLLRLSRRRFRLSVPSSIPTFLTTSSSSTPPLPQKSRLDDLPPEEEWEWGVERTWYSVEVWTTRYNKTAEKWIAGLSPARKQLVERFYDLGIPVALLAMATSILLVLLTATQSWSRLAWLVYLESSPPNPLAPNPLFPPSLAPDSLSPTTQILQRAAKRAFEDITGGTPEHELVGDPMRTLPAGVRGGIFRTYELPPMPEMGGSSFIEPLIPGLTLPLTHLPPLLLSLLLSQMIHESGHLLSSTLLSLPPLRIGIRFFGPLVAAWVALPSASPALDPFAALASPLLAAQERGLGVLFGLGVKQAGEVAGRLRTAAAGPWHNLVVWGLLGLVGWSGVMGVGYWDYGGDGRVVLGFNDATSPLKGHLPVGAVVQYVDDLYLGGKEDTWDRYLLDESGRVDESRGWCVDRKRYAATLQPPCPPSASIKFTSLPFLNTSTTHCLPAYPLLTTRTWPCPCSSASQICVAPLASEGILRIQWVENGREKMRKRDRGSSVLLWMGGRREVWEGVRVGRYAGRGGAVGRWVVGWLELFFVYLSTLSLTLGLLNLLPLPHLDGSHILTAALDIIYPSTVTPPTSSIEDGLANGNGVPTVPNLEIIVEPPTAATVDGLAPVGEKEKEAVVIPEAVVAEEEEEREIIELTEDQIARVRIERILVWGSGAAVALALGGMGVTMAVERW